MLNRTIDKVAINSLTTVISKKVKKAVQDIGVLFTHILIIVTDLTLRFSEFVGRKCQKLVGYTV